MSARVEICRGGLHGERDCRAVEIDKPIRAVILNEGSDPLNQLVVAAAQFGGQNGITIRAIVDSTSAERWKMALEVLIAAILENYAEIRDALTAE